ncbi:hypothetical protein Ga0466249_004030 [Sporomusaceae bacterium BoRhaA]|nr:hypothetical protein [Pelorhabdus rhamnosifermentans]
MKEFMNDRMNRLELKVDGKCENCPTSIAFKERSRSQWWHIKTIEYVLGTALLTIAGYLYHTK